MHTILNSGFQTGITENEVDSSSCECGTRHRKAPRSDFQRNGEAHTVDGNSNALGQEVAIAALESWNLAQLVEQAVVIADAFGRLGVDEFELDVVGICDGQEGGRAWVVLQKSSQLFGFLS